MYYRLKNLEKKLVFDRTKHRMAELAPGGFGSKTQLVLTK